MSPVMKRKKEKTHHINGFGESGPQSMKIFTNVNSMNLIQSYYYQ